MMVAVDEFGRALVSWVGVTSLWATAVLAAVLVIDRLGRRWLSPGARMLLYAVVFVRVVLPVDFASPLGLLPAQEQGSLILPQVTAVATAAPATVVAATEPVATGWPWGVLVVALYALGVAGIALALIVTQVRLHRSLDAGRRRSVDGGPEVFEHATAGPLAVVGKVVIPRRLFDALEPPELRAVVRHERAHLRHGDPWVASVLAAACALLWPVVPVWIAARRIRFLMELRADRAAVAGLDRAGRKTYRAVMLRLASMRWRAPMLSPAFGPVAALEARLAALGGPGWGPVWIQGLSALVIGGVMLCCAGHGEPDEAPLQAQAEVDVEEPEGAKARVCPIPLRGVDNEPTDPEKVRLSARLRAELHDAAGDLAATQRVVKLARAEGLYRVEAEARLIAGQMLFANGDYAAAESTLEDAAWLSASRNHDGMAVATTVELVSLLLTAGDVEQAMAWRRHSQAAQKHVGSDPLPNEARMLRLLIEHLPEEAAELQARLEVVEAACGG